MTSSPSPRFWPTPEMTRWLSGPSNRMQAWDQLCTAAGKWAMRGYGTFAVDERETGKLAGWAGIFFAIDIDEPELCWSLFKGFHGKGYATEAAARAHDWARTEAGLGPLMSFVHPDNKPFQSVARRLGATLEGNTEFRSSPRLFFRHVAGTIH